MPPLAGFFAKFFVFGAAVSGGWTWLAVIGMITSAIAAYYYLRVVVAMYFEQADPELVVEPHAWPSLQVGLAIAAAFTIVVGILPSFWTNLFQAGFGGNNRTAQLRNCGTAELRRRGAEAQRNAENGNYEEESQAAGKNARRLSVAKFLRGAALQGL